MAKLLVIFIWLTSLAIFLIVGYFLGGENEQNTANYINGIIAIASSFSAIGALCTLYFIVQVRHDWKQPKLSDAALDFKLSIKRWMREVDSLCEEIRQQLTSNFPIPDMEKLNFKFENEILAWSELVRLRDKYDFYHGEQEKLTQAFDTLTDLRGQLAIKKPKVTDPLMLVQAHTNFIISITSIERLLPRLKTGMEDVDHKIKIHN